MLFNLSQDNCTIYEHPFQVKEALKERIYYIISTTWDMYKELLVINKRSKKNLSCRRQYIDIDSDRLKHMMYRKPSEIFIYLRFCRTSRVKEIKLYIMCNLFLISCLQQLINCQNWKSYIKIFFGVLSLSRVYSIVF